MLIDSNIIGIYAPKNIYLKIYFMHLVTTTNIQTLTILICFSFRNGRLLQFSEHRQAFEQLMH